MKKLDDFKKRKAEHAAEIEKLSGKLDELRQNRADIENQINAAIDSGDYAAVDKLTAKETDIENRIRAAEKILERKKETGIISKEEITAAVESEMKGYQADVDAKMKEAEKYRRLHFETLIKAGEIVQAANVVRGEYMQLSDETLGGNDVKGVHGGYVHRPFLPGEIDYINGIKPGAVSLINQLRN